MQDAPNVESCGHPPLWPQPRVQSLPTSLSSAASAEPASLVLESICRSAHAPLTVATQPHLQVIKAALFAALLAGGVPASVVALHCCQEPLCQRLLRPASCRPIGQEHLTDAQRPHLNSRGEGALGRSLIQAKPSLACTAGWKASCATCTGRTAQLRSQAGSSAVPRCFSRLNATHAHPHEACRALALKVACTGKSSAVVSTSDAHGLVRQQRCVKVGLSAHMME